MGNDRRNDGPVFFVDGTMKKAKESEKRYMWSKTFDMDEVKRELGTSVVNITVTTKKSPKSADDRLVIFKPSDPKWLPKKKGDYDNGRSGRAGLDSADDDDNIV